jgi:hypothetical protein
MLPVWQQKSKENDMKNKKTLTRILAIIAVIGFMMIACDDGKRPGVPPPSGSENGNGDTEVTFSSLTANGSATVTTTQLTLTFSEVITGLTANDITLTGVAGVTKGSLTNEEKVYTLGISGFSAGGNLRVAVSKSGYAISGTPKTVEIFYNGGSNATVTSVTINQPTSKVETVGTGNTVSTFYGSGVVFTATVQGENNPSQSVTWTIEETDQGTDLNAGTTITDGVLTVHNDDHGKLISITATSTADTTKYDIKYYIRAVAVLPSDFYGIWENENLKVVISSNNKRIESITNPENYYEHKITFWDSYSISSKSAEVNADDTGNEQTRLNYPVGYRVFGDQISYDGESDLHQLGSGSPLFLHRDIKEKMILVRSWDLHNFSTRSLNKQTGGE